MRSPSFLFTCLLSMLSALLVAPVQAQVVPDETLGDESSVLLTDITEEGDTLGLIGGGAIRGGNLFHSFTDFNIRDSEQVFFFSPEGIDDIISRITGSNVSNIDGLLGTFGESNAALTLINPNGVVFSENSRLAVQGSFTATTATAIKFGDSGFFSATEPTTDNLLSIQPSAFFFNGGIGTGDISVVAQENNSPALFVPTEESLLLLGRNILVDGAQVDVWGGKVEIGAILDAGIVGIDDTGKIQFPEGAQRGNIRLDNESVIDVQLSRGGEIRLLADNIDILSGSQLLAGIELGLGDIGNQSGSITLDATGAVTVSGTSTRLINIVESASRGKSGDLIIAARTLNVMDGAQLSIGTEGSGESGTIFLDIQDAALFSGNSLVSTIVGFAAQGSGGNIDVRAGDLYLLDGAQISAASSGTGNSGNIRLLVDETASFQGSSPNAQPGGIFSSIDTEGFGNSGDIEIFASNLELLDGAQISAASFGAGNSGDTKIFASNLELLDGAQISAASFGTGNSGDINIFVRDTFRSQDGTVDARAEVSDNGQINIQAKLVVLSGDSDIQSFSSSGGNDGNISIRNTVALVALDDSDIVVDASGGRGGNLSIEKVYSDNLDPFGLSDPFGFRDPTEVDNNGKVDIIATGSISVDNLSFVSDVSFSELPDTIVNTEVLISNSCIARSENSQGNLILTSRNSLSPIQNETTYVDYPAGTVRSIPTSPESATINEPSAIYQLAGGRLIMSRSCQE